MVTPSTTTLPLPVPTTSGESSSAKTDVRDNRDAGGGMLFAARLGQAIQSRKPEEKPKPTAPPADAPPQPDAEETPQTAVEHHAAADDHATAPENKTPDSQDKSDTKSAVPAPAIATPQVVVAVTVLPPQQAAVIAAAPDLAPTPTVSVQDAANALPAPNIAPQTAAPAALQPTPVAAASTQTATPAQAQVVTTTVTAQNAPVFTLSVANEAAPAVAPTQAIPTLAPNAPGLPVDSRTVVGTTVPGTEQASLPQIPATVTLAAASVEPAAVSAPHVPPAGLAVAQPTQTAQNAAQTAPVTPIVPQAEVVPVKSETAVAPKETVPTTETVSVPQVKPDAVHTGEHLARLQAVGEKPAEPLPIPAQAGKVVVTATAGTKQETTLPALAQNATGTPLTPVAADSATTSGVFTSPFDLADTTPAQRLPLNTLNLVASLDNAPRPASGEAAIVRTASVSNTTTAGNAIVAEAKSTAGSNAQSQFSDAHDGATNPNAETTPVKPNAAAGAATASEIEPTNAVQSVPASTTIDRRQLIEQVTQHLETLRFSGGRGEAAFRLNPDHLGALHVTITTQTDGVVARVVAEHAHVQQALENSKEHLRNALENRGLHLDRLEVSVGQGANPDGRSAGNGAQQAFQERAEASRYTTRASRSAAEPAAAQAVTAPVRVAGDRISRLDYRA